MPASQRAVCLRGDVAGAMPRGLCIYITHVPISPLWWAMRIARVGHCYRDQEITEGLRVFQRRDVRVPHPRRPYDFQPARVHHPSIALSIGDMGEQAMTAPLGGISTMICRGGGHERDNNHITMKDLLSPRCRFCEQHGTRIWYSFSS